MANKPVHFIGSSLKDLRAMPDQVRQVFGYALYLAEQGEKHDDAKPLKGFSGAGVLEVVEDFDGNTYRAIYTVKFADATYVLDVFQKKSTKGVATPKVDMERIKTRLKAAEDDHRAKMAAKSKKARSK